MLSSLERMLRFAFDRRAIPFARNYLLGRPFYASFDITTLCNLRCEGCDYPVLLGKNMLGADIPLAVLEKRTETLGQAFGSLVVVLAGFEPTIRRDLADIISSASQHHYVGMVTNGTLINRERAEAYWAAGLAFASVSMPAFEDERFKAITGVSRYGVADIEKAIETLIATAPQAGLVAITATIDNKTTPGEMKRLAAYAQSKGALVSFQPYSSSKPASAEPQYDLKSDERAIQPDTVQTIFNGSIADAIIQLKRDHPNVVGRDTALRNFDTFVREGTIPFRPRALKIYTNGDISLYPEGEVFSNADKAPEEIAQDHTTYTRTLKERGPLRANNCYRCVNLTNPSPLLEQLASIRQRSWSSSVNAAGSGEVTESTPTTSPSDHSGSAIIDRIVKG